jgi:hypothetical protein
MNVSVLENVQSALRVEEAGLGTISSRLIMSLRGPRQVIMETEGLSCSDPSAEWRAATEVGTRVVIMYADEI